MKQYTYRIYYKSGDYGFQTCWSKDEAMILAQAMEIQSGRDWNNIMTAERVEE